MASSKRKNRRGDAKSPQGIERLLSAQTTVILQAVDKRLSAQDKKFEARFDAIDRRFDAQDKKFEGRFTAIERRIDKLEETFLEKLNYLTNTLDHFLKRIIDVEDEFTFMKHDVDRIKAVLREKLGVVLD
jgi:hypothetical protein